MIKLKIIVGGAKDVGKTTLIKRYISGHFESDTLSTIGVDFMTKNLKIDDQEVHLSLWDFAGEEKFRILFPSYCSGASGALILYDITRRDTFKDVDDWMNLINTSSGKICKLLIGAKCDLEDKREISLAEGEKYGQEFADIFFESSSKTGQNVENIFTSLTRKILESSLRKCPHCGELIPKELLFCQFCGKKIAQ